MTVIHASLAASEYGDRGTILWQRPDRTCWWPETDDQIYQQK